MNQKDYRHLRARKNRDQRRYQARQEDKAAVAAEYHRLADHLPPPARKHFDEACMVLAIIHDTLLFFDGYETKINAENVQEAFELSADYFRDYQQLEGVVTYTDKCLRMGLGIRWLTQKYNEYLQSIGKEPLPLPPIVVDCGVVDPPAKEQPVSEQLVTKQNTPVVAVQEEKPAESEVRNPLIGQRACRRGDSLEYVIVSIDSDELSNNPICQVKYKDGDVWCSGIRFPLSSLKIQ